MDNKIIKLLRLKSGLRQVDVAQRLNISQNAYNKLEIGETALTVERLIELSKIFEVSPSKLLNELVNNPHLFDFTQDDCAFLLHVCQKYYAEKFDQSISMLSFLYATVNEVRQKVPFDQLKSLLDKEHQRVFELLREIGPNPESNLPIAAMIPNPLQASFFSYRTLAEFIELGQNARFIIDKAKPLLQSFGLKVPE